MIVDFIWSAIVAGLGAVMGLFPHFTFPTWLASCPGGGQYLGCYLQDFGHGMAQLNGWLPVDAAANLLPVVFAAVVINWTIRLVRMVISLLSGGGGGSGS